MKAAQICGIEEQPKLNYPENPEYGDFSSNSAMLNAKPLGISPKALAEKIVIEFKKIQPKFVEKVEIAGPGFINFFLKAEYFAENIKRALKEGDKFGSNNNLKKQKTIIEFTDPNPFKEFHVGHLMSNTIGESVSRIVEANGAEVKRACYQGDVGLHVAKAVAHFLYKKKDIHTESDLNGLALGVDYVAGNKLYDADTDFKKSVEEVNKKLYEKSDKAINEVYEIGKKKSLEFFAKRYEALGMKFDYFFSESEVAGYGKQMVEDNLGKVFEKSDGAVVFEAQKVNPKLHTRVFVNSNGLPTYEAKELGLVKIKHDKYPYEKSIVLTGNEINDYFNVLLEAMKLIFPELAGKTLHIGHGMLRLPSGKMSSRTGEVITAVSLINDVKALVLEKVKDRNVDETMSDMVTIGAIKYSILRQAIGGDIIFDFDKSISFEGDSGPYLQYTYVRAKSILEKAASFGIIDSNKPIEFKVPQDHKPNLVEKLIVRFPEVVERAGKEYAPHLIVTYLTELAGAFNSWYGQGKIVDEKDPDSLYKVALTKAVSITIKNGLNLLGIGVPEKM